MKGYSRRSDPGEFRLGGGVHRRNDQPDFGAVEIGIAADAAVWSRLHRPLHGRSSIAFFHCGSSVTNLPPMRAAVRAITPITPRTECLSATLPGTRKP